MEKLERQLVCPVCLEMFSKPVVILPCQHNLCRKCANDIYQAANPMWQSRGAGVSGGSGGRFRCPSCRHDVVLDRHGVYGLQRNLLVENIIDIYRQQNGLMSVKPAPLSPQLMCEEHPEERINIYCLCCQTPTCCMCKVFGSHRDCEVAPLSNVYIRRKSELSDGIAVLVASNDHIQTLISQMEMLCRTIEENGQHQRDHLSLSFDSLVNVLEQKKQMLVEIISKTEDQKLQHVQGLIQKYSEHLERAVSLVESAITTMDEQHLPVFIQTAKDILEKMSVSAGGSDLQRLEFGFENMSSFIIDTDHISDLLQNMDFGHGSVNLGDEDDEEENVSEPDCPLTGFSSMKNT